MPSRPTATITPARRVQGRLRVPGDKSISHRYALLARARPRADPSCATIAPAPTASRRWPACARSGVEVVDRRRHRHSCGTRTARLPFAVGAARRRQLGHDDADAGRDAGGQPFDADDDRRRVAVAPPDAARHRAAGADGRAHRGDRRPRAADRPRARRCTRLHYTPTVPSAQVKSAVILAGLHTDGTTSVTEPAQTRDHTERALAAFGFDGRRRRPHGVGRGRPARHRPALPVPGDFSSAAFWMVAAAALPGLAR